MWARVVWVLLLASACSDTSNELTEPSVARADPPASQPSPRVGRFESESLCLVLLENGDAELLINRQPKLLVLGRATREGETLELAVERIWAARYLSRCRERHEVGHWEERTRALGVELRRGSTVTLRLVAESDDRVRLCAGETCETLTRAPLRLPSAWRAESRPAAAIPAGTLVQLDLADDGFLGYGTAEGVGRAYGAVTVTPATDGFEVAFEPERVDGEAPVVLGRPVVAGTTRRFHVERLSGQRLSVRSEGCERPACAVVLARHFDSHAYAVE